MVEPPGAGTRATRTAVAFSLPPAVVLGAVLGLTVGWIAGVVVFVVLAAALGSWALLAGDRLVERRLSGAGARPADAVGEARLINLVEGLVTGAGVGLPRLVVVDSPGLNAMIAGSDSRRGVMAVTSGLLAELDRMELEAVVASQLWRLRHGETRPATVLAATFGLGRSLALDTDLDNRTDQGAVSLTRYPPGLAAALEKIDAKGSAVSTPGWMAHLWLADPRPPAGPGAGARGAGRDRGRVPLAERVEALREL